MKVVDPLKFKIVPVRNIPPIEHPAGFYRNELRKFVASTHATIRLEGISRSTAYQGLYHAIKAEGLKGKVRVIQRKDSIYLAKAPSMIKTPAPVVETTPATATATA